MFLSKNKNNIKMKIPFVWKKAESFEYKIFISSFFSFILFIA
jgi:hypothetical protein